MAPSPTHRSCLAPGLWTPFADPMHVAILVLAAGRGRRLGGPVPKAFVPVQGVTLLERSVARLAATVPNDRTIVVAVHPDDRAEHIEPILSRLQELGVTAVVDGGATRADSMANALAAVPGAQPAATTLVLVHDAARPFFPIEATRHAIAEAATHGAALLALPARDTLKQVAPPAPGSDPTIADVQGTIDRATVWLAQTPQVIRRDLLEQALAAPGASAATDDVALVEALGHPVRAIAGTPANFKVTTNHDLLLAEAVATALDAEARSEDGSP